jgi:hypothetical protein
VNHSPSFGTDTALDVRVKTHALHGAINSLQLSTAARQRVLDRQRRAQRRRLYGKKTGSVHRRKQVRTQSVHLGLNTPCAVAARTCTLKAGRWEATTLHR